MLINIKGNLGSLQPQATLHKIDIPKIGRLVYIFEPVYMLQPQRTFVLMQIKGKHYSASMYAFECKDLNRSSESCAAVMTGDREVIYIK